MNAHLGSAAVDDGGPPVAFGDYRLLRRLGAGGMGEVFLATTTGLGDIEKLLVVKTLREDYTRDPEYVRRFIDEARVVVRLNHRNICQVFDVGRVGEQYYLAMEHIDGRDLKSLLARVHATGATLPPAMAVFLASEVLEALDYAHRLTEPATGQALHLVHRDVSPQNVMVNFEGEAKLIDFGLAVSRLKVERTRPDVVMGKLAYMAPEQARGDPPTPAIDVFALGVTLYEMLSGQRYYEGLSAPQVFERVGGKTVDGREYRPPAFAALDPAIRAVLDRALRSDPAARYPNCGAFHDDLERWLVENKLRSGTRQVRALLAETFGEEQAAARARHAPARPTPAPKHPPRAQAEETVRIAFDPAALQELFDSGEVPSTAEDSGSGNVFASSAAPAPAPPSRPADERTEHTERVARVGATDDADSTRPRRLAIIGAAALAGVVLAGAAAWQAAAWQAAGGADPAPTLARDAPQGDDVEDTAPTNTPTDTPTDTLTGDSAVEDSAAEDSAAEDSAAEDSAVEDSTAQPRARRQPARTSRSRRAAARRAPPVASASSTQQQAPPADRPPTSSAPADDERGAIARRARALAGCACGAELSRRAAYLAGMPGWELRSFAKQVAACEGQCAR